MPRAMLEEDRCLVLTLIGAGNDMHKGFIHGYVTPSAVGSCFVANPPIFPLMIITGDRKKKKAAWEPIRTLYDHAPAPKYLIRLRKTDHMAVSDLGVLVSNPVANSTFRVSAFIRSRPMPEWNSGQRENRMACRFLKMLDHLLRKGNGK